jgi:hypothetical protein
LTVEGYRSENIEMNRQIEQSIIDLKIYLNKIEKLSCNQIKELLYGAKFIESDWVENGSKLGRELVADFEDYIVTVYFLDESSTALVSLQILSDYQ